MTDARIDSLKSHYSGSLLTDPAEMAPFLCDWRKVWRGEAWAVARPKTTAEVAEILRWCAETGTPVVPQGGNTGLSGGSVPDVSGEALLLSLTRLDRVRSVDTLNNTLTVEAGCLLATVQDAAAQADRLFPLSLAAEGSCTIGGNLATNAGGTAVLRYGNARDLCLGLEVVTATGEIWDGLSGLRKDNTGYDLRDLFIGSEGTLGVITAAVLKLFPRPAGRAVAIAGFDTPEQIVKVFDLARTRLDATLTAFEIFARPCLDLVLKHVPDLIDPLETRCAWYALIEATDLESDEQARERLTATLGAALELDLAIDAVLANSLSQAAALWRLRENISEAQSAEGPNIKHDISLPISCLAEFLRVCIPAVESQWPIARVIAFGHAGDGNIHFNVSPASGADLPTFTGLLAEINTFVHDEVSARRGSISAEHGLGVLRRDEAARYRSPAASALMGHIKGALDPQEIMNPTKVLASIGGSSLK